MDIAYLLFLQDFRNGIDNALTPFMEWISKFAVTYLYMVPVFIYWAVNKRKGLYTLVSIFSRVAPFYSIFTTFLPGAVISMILCLLFYPLTLAVSRIGGSHG